MNFNKLLFFFILSLFTTQLFAGGIRGSIKNDQGEPLPFATIYIKSEATGTTTNVEGNYSIALTPGTYELLFQYLGYQSVLKTVTVKSSGYTEKHVTLKQEVLNLQMVEVTAGEENPAYTIMRKTIAKSKFHLQQLDSYNATVYIKGSGRLKKAPFWLRKKLKKEGIDPSKAYASESVSEISYTRPNTYDERVISVYSNGDDNSTSPMAYINGSFYEPEVAGSISPLSPKAFGYYKFALEGTFYDQGRLINKIRVVPRSRGDKVFEGILNIVDEEWSLHSLAMKTNQYGITFSLSQIYKPIEDKAWLPVSHTFEMTGKFLGFSFVYNYLATVSNYEIELNPDLEVEMVVIDETIEKERAEALKNRTKKQIKRDEELSEIQEKLTDGEEISRKELKKMMKDYEKQELKEAPEPMVESNRTFTVDSLAAKRDTAYWATIRPVPLTQYEVAGYQYRDSLVAVEKSKENPDSTRAAKKGNYKPWDILFNHSFKLAEDTYLNLGSPFERLHFNTVEGWRTDYDVNISKRFKNKNELRVGGRVAYSLARNKLTEKGYLKYRYGPKLQQGNFLIEGGQYVFQINPDNPMSPIINSFMTLLFEENYMKLLQKDYLLIKNDKYFKPNFRVITDVEWSKRQHLENQDVKPWINYKRDFTSNSPENLELDTTFFATHKAFTVHLGVEYKPWLRYSIRNGKRRIINEDNTPLFSLNYRKGIPDITSSVTNFDHLELGFKYKFAIGVRGFLGFNAKAGFFLNNENVTFPDYKHFMGNRTPFVTTDPVETFRLMDYYDFSTDNTYFVGHTHYQFRKFLATQFMEIRFLGIKENIFVNYLNTDMSENYTELGYSLDYIFRFFRLEFVTSYRDFKYENWGIRIGIGTEFGNKFFSVD